MRGQRKNPRKAVQPFENKKRKIDIFKNYEANGVEKIQRKLEIFSTLISKKSTEENPHVTGVAFGERKMDDVLSAARSTFTPKITEIKLRNQVAAAVRQNINDLISSTKITK